ncbi:MAG: NADH-quinone oxidoreductase subunit J family protein [Acidimicrobiales bacterium]
MIAQNIAFGIIAAGVVVAALRVVTTPNVVHAALWLIVVLGGVGASFLLLGAEFVGVTQILVYIGAIVVLFLFGIMLTRAPIGRTAGLTGRNWASALVVSLALAGVLGYVLIDAFGDEKLPEDTRVVFTPDETDPSPDEEVVAGSNTAAVGDSIFADYLVPFEVVGLLLTASLIGAIAIARKE